MSGRRNRVPKNTILDRLNEYSHGVPGTNFMRLQRFLEVEVPGDPGWGTAMDFILACFAAEKTPSPELNIIGMALGRILTDAAIQETNLPRILESITTTARIPTYPSSFIEAWDLFWDIVTLSNEIYSHFFHGASLCEEIAREQYEESPSAPYFIERIAMVAQPMDLYLAIRAYLIKYCGVPIETNLGLEGAVEIGFIMSMFELIKDFSDKSGVNEELIFNFIANPTININMFSPVWNTLILSFNTYEEKQIKSPYTFPCRVFSFLICSLFAFNKWDKFNNMFVETALKLLKSLLPSYLSSYFTDIIDVKYSDSFAASIRQQAGWGNAVVYLNFVSTEIAILEEDVLQNIEGKQVSATDTAYLGFLLQKVLSVDPGVLQESLTIGSDNSYFNMISPFFFNICKFYNTMMLQIVTFEEWQEEYLSIIKPTLEIMIEKKSLLYFGTVTFSALLNKLYSPADGALFRDAAFNICFSLFNTSDEESCNYLLTTGYFVWRNDMSDNTVMTQASLWRSVQKAFVTNFSKLTGMHIVYEIEDDEEIRRSPHFESGEIRDYNNMMPLIDLEGLLPHSQDLDQWVINNDFNRLRDLYPDKSPEEALTIYHQNQYYFFRDSLEVLALHSFLSNVILGGLDSSPVSDLILQFFEAISSTEEEGQEPFFEKARNLLKYKQPLDNKIDNFLAGYLIRGDTIYQSENPYFELNNFLIHFFITFSEELSLPSAVVTPIPSSESRLIDYFSSFDWGVIFDMDWGYFLDIAETEIEDLWHVKGPLQLSDYFQEFSKILHPLHKGLVENDDAFGKVFTKSRMANQRTVYNLHDYEASVQNLWENTVAYLPLLTNINERIEIRDTFTAIDQRFIDVLNFDENVIQDPFAAASYARKTTELRSSWWTLISLLLYQKVAGFYDLFVRGFDLESPRGFILRGDRRSPIIRSIESLFLACDGYIELCDRSTEKQDVTIASFRQFVQYLKTVFETFTEPNLGEDEEASFDRRLVSIYVVNIYFQALLALSYMEIFMKRPNILTLTRLPLDDKLFYFQLACMNINFFPSFTSIQTHKKNICSIFDVLSLAISTTVRPSRPGEQTTFNTQILFSYLTYNSAETILHYRALHTLGWIMLREDISSLVYNLEFEEDGIFANEGEGVNFPVQSFLEFNGPLYTREEDGNINVYAMIVNLLVEFKVMNPIQLLLVPWTALVAENRTPLGFRSNLFDGIDTLMRSNFSAPDGVDDPIVFFNQYYLRLEHLDHEGQDNENNTTDEQ